MLEELENFSSKIIFKLKLFLVALITFFRFKKPTWLNTVLLSQPNFF